MRPIVWGLIVFFICGVLWLMSTIFAALEAFGGTVGVFTWIFVLTMLGTFLSIPVAIVAEVIRWLKHRKQKQAVPIPPK